MCPFGSFPLFGLNFPGFKDYCICEEEDTKLVMLDHMHQNQCKSKGNVLCRKSSRIGEIYKSYRDTILCKKLTEFRYEAYVSVDNQSECPQGTRVCGKDRKKFLCLSKTHECPVNYLRITHDKKKAEAIPGARILDLGNRRYLIYSNENVHHEIIVQFDWGFGRKCINPEELVVMRKEGLKFLGNSDKFVEECSTFFGEGVDARWHVLDKYNFYDFLSENSPVFKHLTYSDITSPELLTQPFMLQTRSYIHFDSKCKTQGNLSLYENLENMTILNHSHHNSFYILLIISLVIACAFTIMSFVYCFCGSRNVNPKLQHILCLIMLIILIIFLVLSAVTFSQINRTANVSKELTSEKCVDSETASQFHFAWKRRMFFWGMLGVILTMAILSLLLLVCQRCFCWFKVLRSDRLFSHFPMELLDDSVRDSNASSMKYPFEQEGRNRRISDNHWDLYDFSDRGSNYNYWDTPDQEINEFNYSFNK
jgi:hypothetical protein